MFQEIEVQLSEIEIMSYELSIFDKDNSKLILVRVFQNEDLEIKWNAIEGRKYHVKMVECENMSKTSATIKEIINEEKVSSTIVPGKEIKAGSFYRIVVKDLESRYYAIIVVQAK